MLQKPSMSRLDDECLLNLQHANAVVSIRCRKLHVKADATPFSDLSLTLALGQTLELDRVACSAAAFALPAP